MSHRSTLALSVISVALIFGFVADRLLMARPWGINVLLVCALLIAIAFGLARWRDVALSGGGRGFALPALVFAGLLALRDTFALTAFNLLAMLCCLAMLAFSGRAGRVVVAGIGRYVRGLVMGVIGAAIGALPLAMLEVRWRALNLGGSSRMVSRVLIGVVLALPLLAVFGGLFAAADAGFEKLLRDVFDFNLDNLLIRTFLTGFWAWLAAGMLWLMFFANNSERAQSNAAEEPARWLSLGLVEIGVVLGLLNALFAAFVSTQLRYFFGGAALVLDTADASNQLTFAEYARRGFFELVVVAALLLVVLLAANWITRRDTPRHELIFRALAGGLIALLYVVMASALNRMSIYMRVYGLTELRLYTTTFMIWLAIVFAWFIATTLRSRGDRFAFGAVVSGLATLLVLNLLNPIDMIVRTNIERIVNGPAADPDTPKVSRTVERLDSLYLAGLALDSADAVPALMRNFSRLGDDDRCIVAAALGRRFEQKDAADWRTANASRLSASAWLSRQWGGYFVEQGASCEDRLDQNRGGLD